MITLCTKRALRPLRGTIQIPGDKSLSHRAVMLTAIANGEANINGLLEAEDTMATINAFRSMGVNIRKHNETWRIIGIGLHGLKPPQKPLYLGNSGTTTRLLMGILAAQNFETILHGDKSLQHRPMRRITEPLTAMGAQFEFLENDGCLPVKVKGNPNLKAIKNYQLPVASAQIKSAILLAALYAKGETSIIENTPSRNHTETMLTHLGANLRTETTTTTTKIALSPTTRLCSPQGGLYNVRIPADPSAAAFFITAALTVPRSEISMHGINTNPTRIGFINASRSLGYDVVIGKEDYALGEPYAEALIARYRNIPSASPQQLTIPPATMIDEYPILTVLAACGKRVLRMPDIAELRHKESDRINAMEEGLRACGVTAESGDNWMQISGNGKVSGDATIKTYMDHRIAMSFIILGLTAQKPIILDDVSPINTSFPSFFAQLKTLGIDYEDRL